MEEISLDEALYRGFELALCILEEQHRDIDRSAVQDRLEEVADGGQTVHNTPEEEVARRERLQGRQLAQQERQDVLAFYGQERRELDANNTTTANGILRYIRQELMGR